MGDSCGGSDDLIWDGLPCPPLEDDAFNFDPSANYMFDDLLSQKDDEELCFEEDAKFTESKKSTRIFGKGKEIKTLGQLLEFEMHSRTFYGFHPLQVAALHDNKKAEFDGVTKKPVEKRKSMDCNSTTTDYDSKFEASRQKLHDRYEQDREVKKQKQIQVIDFRKLVEPPRCKAKSKGKASLRQKLMVMGNRKTNKKFPPFATLCSCN